MINKDLKARFDEIEKQYKEIKAKMKELEEKEQFQYPIYAFSKTSSLIVKFTDLNTGAIIKANQFYKIGVESANFIEHTDTKHWQILPVCEKTGFYHGQPVWGYYEDWKTNRFLGFYDAINKNTFKRDGSKNGFYYELYEPFEGEWQPWMVEAFKELEL